jgi:outer membrane protein assembly factor BamB
VVLRADGCRVAWTSSETAPTSVPKASHGNGLLYVYTKPPRDDGIDAWYLTAIDIRTGDTVWSRLTGTGTQWNSHYAAIYLGPDGTAYIATLAGLVRIADGRR